MMETDNLSRDRSMGQRDGSPGSHSPARPMRQLEFNQAMSDFRHMFPETDEEVIEAVLRANSGMVDATIDQLLTMNIDAEFERDEEDDLPDHVLVSVEQEVLAQQQLQPTSQGFKDSKSSKKAEAFSSSKDGEDCPPSYTEAVQSHLSHYRSSNRRHKLSPPTSAGYNNSSVVNNGNGTNIVPSRTISGGHHHHRMPRNGMQHLLDLGPDSAPSANADNVSPPVTSSPGAVTQAGGHASRSQNSRHHHHHHHHHHNHSQRSSNHHRRRADNPESSSPHKSSRPGRNLLASMSVPSYTHHELASEEFGFRPRRKGSFDSNDCSPDSRDVKSPQRWRPSTRESASVKRPAFRNWNPPMLGTLPDDFLRILPRSASPVPPSRPKHAPHLHRAMSAIGPERPRFLTAPPGVDHGPVPSRDPQMTSSFRHSGRSSTSNPKPHRSLSFAGHSSQTPQQPPRRAPTTLHPSAGLVQHDLSSDILQERMKENERRRHIAASSGLDPELTQYLEDERLAIMLQNSEFLQTLRGDRNFMMALEQDHSGHETEDPPPAPPPPAQPDTAPVNPNGLNSDEEEGYGDEGRQTLEAFPFSKQLPAPATSEDMELRKKLKHMGKASRKQFAALARKFFSKRKKKSSHQILKESQAPSMMNLLDEDDDDDDMDDVNNGGTGTDPYNSTSGNLRNSWSERQGRHFDEV